VLLVVAAMGACSLGHRVTPRDLDSQEAKSRRSFPIYGQWCGGGGGTRCGRVRVGRGGRHVNMVGMMKRKVEADLAQPYGVI